jgi:tetratricopeptide (TPR) repeat protein
LQAFDIALSLDSQHVLSWFGKSLVLINLGKINMGKKAFIRANQLALDLSLMRRTHGGSLFLSKKSRSYAGRLDRRARLPQEISKDWYRAGRDLYQRQQYDEAIAAFRRVLALDPENARSWYYLGRSYTSLRKYQQALEAYGHAIAINPLNTAVWNNKGLIYRGLGQTETAITAFQRAIEIDPGYFNGWYNLGLVYLDQEHYDLACDAFDHALAIHPGDPRALNRKQFAEQAEKSPKKP